MSEQFIKADSSVYEKYLQLVEETYPNLSGFSFGLLFRTKLKRSRGNTVLAEICLPSKLMSYFAKDASGNPYDYLMIIDEMAWACGHDSDRVRLMRHELRHVFIDDKGTPKLIGHDFADFHKEVELNQDSPMWAANLSEVVLAGYNSLKDGGKDPRSNRIDSDEIKPIEPKQRQVQIEAALPLSKDPGKETENIVKKKVTSGPIGVKVDNPDSPSMKLNELAKKRGLVPASASQI